MGGIDKTNLCVQELKGTLDARDLFDATAGLDRRVESLEALGEGCDTTLMSVTLEVVGALLRTNEKWARKTSETSTPDTKGSVRESLFEVVEESDLGRAVGKGVLRKGHVPVGHVLGELE